ncbi:MAG: hypothetical protein IPJ55_17165 [Chloracidobacterium sp.]|nr:hypothetical protein [Chloracidobacterium sp.]
MELALLFNSKKKGKMTTLKEEFDLMAEDLFSAKQEAVVVAETNKALFADEFSRINSQEFVRYFWNTLCSLNDPEDDYKGHASSKYLALVGAAEAFNLTLPKDMPDGISCPKSFAVWYSRIKSVWFWEALAEYSDS